MDFGRFSIQYVLWKIFLRFLSVRVHRDITEYAIFRHYKIQRLVYLPPYVHLVAHVDSSSYQLDNLDTMVVSHSVMSSIVRSTTIRLGVVLSGWVFVIGSLVVVSWWVWLCP